MRVFYDLFIFFLSLAFRLAAVFHAKARAWVDGRKNWRAAYRTRFQKSGKLLWIHAASLGEFEQGRPIIEAFRKKYPDWQIVLTFFSPSGFAIRKNYPLADFVCYLPIDSRRNARDFLDFIQPDAAVFVKYEFWANYLFELKRRNIPTLLASALFRPEQPFFQWYGAFWRQMLGCFSHIFLQNQASAKLLRQIGLQNFTIAGDTRVDRVLELAKQAPKNEIVAAFLAPPSPPTKMVDHFSNFKSEKLPLLSSLIAGSTWPADEDIILPILENTNFENFRLVIAPHEPSEKHLAQLEARLKKPAIRYSTLAGGQSVPAERRLLLIDNVGMLNSLYQYGWVAYIGGGFGKGIHNTLEPAAFGLPIIFGPRYEKFEEARQFVARGAAFPVKNTAELIEVLEQLKKPELHQKAARAALHFLEENRGATDAVLQFLATCNDLAD